MRQLRRGIRRPPAPSWAGALSGLALLLLVVVLVAGCGGDSTPGVARADDGGSGAATSTTATTEASVDPEQAQLDFAQCMRDQGLDFPDPQPDAEGNLRFQPPGGGGDPDQGALREGLEACEQHLQNGGGQLERPDDPEFQDSLLEFARCMRDEGIDVPDPQGGEAPGARAAGIDMDDPAVQAALEECRSIVQRGPGGQGGTP